VKLLETAGKTIQKAAAAVARKVSPPAPMRSRDPWYRDDERKAEINEDTRWLGPRPNGWLR
jgi:hypothetical protein